jgi:hypothetical protein
VSGAGISADDDESLEKDKKNEDRENRGQSDESKSD